MAKMGEWFKPKMPALPDAPKPVRMPTETDPDIIAAGRREAELRKNGRLSTMKTTKTQTIAGNTIIGSSGGKLGA